VGGDDGTSVNMSSDDDGGSTCEDVCVFEDGGSVNMSG